MCNNWTCKQIRPYYRQNLTKIKINRSELFTQQESHHHLAGHAVKEPDIPEKKTVFGSQQNTWSRGDRVTVEVAGSSMTEYDIRPCNVLKLDLIFKQTFASFYSRPFFLLMQSYGVTFDNCYVSENPNMTICRQFVSRSIIERPSASDLFFIALV